MWSEALDYCSLMCLTSSPASPMMSSPGGLIPTDIDTLSLSVARDRAVAETLRQ